ncbi:hypothetical protein [Bacillus haynesii]|uniref:hypothetical protein n=1 Tax=Bacillus haynesii TaxID=1925021 RepID=UPI00227FEBFF|nr:hypothetical protein [Bacillus haynesii]MCY8142023.1 hypothetical protein [Bacillus haynesii]MCY8677905.1 hypothetical protein [Bacillus haynesii]MCY9245322.1 hypothetical protein [Bacillus haynesii]MCY9322346.1 hypothetical protein [Bacillus haynesii]MEC1457665.1 hypothetical protein [Bacillus haynesii]
MFKKCVAMFLGVVLIFSMIPYASAVEGKNKYVVAKEVILKTQEEFIQSMKKLSPKNDDEADEFSTQYFKDNPVNEEHLINFYKKEKTVLPNATSGDTIDIDNYIQSNIDEGNFSEQDLGNGIKLVLTDSPTYFITSVSETPIDENKFQVKARTKEHKLVYRAKNMFGIELFKVHNAAYFTYGGKSPRAHQTSAYYKRGTTSLWRVENWKKGTRSVPGNKAQAYAEGNFFTGFAFKGFDIIIQEWHITNTITCNNKGKVERSGRVK